MNPQSEQHDDWTSCEPGTVRNLTRQLAANRRLNRIRKGAAVGSLVIAVVAVGLAVQGLIPRNESPESTHGGITCREVQSHLTEFIAGTLNGPIGGQIREHLAACSACRDKHDSLSAQVSHEQPFDSVNAIAMLD